MGLVEVLVEAILSRRSLTTINKMCQIDMNLKDEYGRNPISVAAKMGNLEVIKFLLKSSTKLLQQSKYTEAFKQACDSEKINYDMLRFLLNEGAKVDPDTGHLSGMYYAGYYVNMELMEFLLKNRSKDVQRGLFGAVNSLYNKDYQVFTEMDMDLYQLKLDKNQMMIKFFLDKGANIDKNDDFFRKTPLYFASKNGSLQNLKLLLEYRDQTEKESIYLNKALMAQFTLDDPSEEIIRFLVDRGANPNLKNERGVSILTYLYSKNKVDLAKYLMEKGGKTQDRANSLWLGSESPFLYACHKGDREMASLFLSNGSSIKETDTKNYTSLHHASRFSDMSLVEFLIGKGSRDYNGALLSACKSNNTKIQIKELLSLSADPNARDQWGKSALYYSAYNGNLSHVQDLVEMGANQYDEAFSISSLTNSTVDVMNYLINSGHCNVDLCLFSLCKSRQQNTDLLTSLIDKKADVNALDADSKTPIHYASSHLNIPYMKELLEIKPSDKTLSLLAVSRLTDKFAIKVATFLLQAKADPNARDLRDDKTSLVYAVEKNNVAMVELLLVNGAREELDSCLYQASSKNQKEIVIRLLREGADPSKIIGNQSSLSLAVKNNFVDIIDMFKFHKRNALQSDEFITKYSKFLQKRIYHTHSIQRSNPKARISAKTFRFAIKTIFTAKFK